MKKMLILTLIAVTFFLAPITNALAQVIPYAGELDPNFGTDGIVQTALYWTDGVEEMALQDDGKIVTVGNHLNISTSPFGLQFTIARYDPSGILDSGFGNDGIVSTNLSTYPDNSWSYARSVAIQSDGKIVVVGSTLIRLNVGREVVALARYNQNGTLDNTFGIGGIVRTDLNSSIGFGNEPSGAYDVAIQSDGKIVVVGFSSNRPVIVRYLPNGSLDNSFGNNGVYIPAGVIGVAQNVVVQPDGKMLVASQTFNGSNYDISLLRLNSNSTPDTSFGDGGIARTAITPYSTEYPYGLAIQTDGKIVVTGGNDADIVTIRYNTDGSLDNTFDNDGIALVDIAGNPDYGFDITFDLDGKAIVVGQTQIGSQHDIILIRFNSDGSLDSCFGQGGKVITSTSQEPDRGHAVVVQPDGMIVVGGTVYANFAYTFAVLRYGGTICAPNNPPVADTGGPYYVNEGSSIILAGNGSDPENNPLTYAWDFDNNGTYETSGQSPIFSAASYDGPNIIAIGLQVCDNKNLCAVSNTTVSVVNVAPTAIFSIDPSIIIMNETAVLAFGNQYDPSAVDLETGFQYSYDCTDDGVYEVEETTQATYNCTYLNSGVYSVHGVISDKDDGSSSYSASITVQTPSEATNTLIELVELFNLQHGISNSLIAKLNNVLNVLNDGNQNNDHVAVNSLNAFINAVEAQRGKKITSEQANQLINVANRIILSLQH